MLTKRQEMILSLIRQEGEANRIQIQQALEPLFERCSKVTVLRDLETLIRAGFIVKHGATKAALYTLPANHRLLESIDVDSYFKTEHRPLICPTFNFEVLPALTDLLNAKERAQYAALNSRYLAHRERMSPTVLRKEMERLTVEMAWKSSHLEGNTYTLLETERLLKEQVVAHGRSTAETQMIINHQTALDYIRYRPEDYREISLRKIEDLHRLLMTNLGVNYGMRKTLVGIIGTDYRPLDNALQITKALTLASELINSTVNPLEKALIAVLLVSYIQPFEDGNKRTARLLGNAMLLASDYCPLSYKSVDEIEYKKALILFYEQNKLAYFKKLFLEQYAQAVDKYFG